MGEDIAGGMGAPGDDDAWGGVLGVTKGLYDIPRSRAGHADHRVRLRRRGGRGRHPGLRPVAELMFVDFLGVCLDQIMNQAAKFRYMFGGKAITPVVIRTMYGAGLRAAAQHSQACTRSSPTSRASRSSLPSSPYEAKGLLIQSIRDDDPVIFCEHKAHLRHLRRGPGRELHHSVRRSQRGPRRRRRDHRRDRPHGRRRRGSRRRTRLLRGRGRGDRPAHDQSTRHRDDPRSVENTGRLVIVDEASPRCNLATDISALVARGFASLRAPIEMVTPPHTPVPFSDALEDLYIPGPAGGQRGESRGGLDSVMAEIQRVTMPKWGLSMKTGRITDWLATEGDDITEGDDLFDIDTDKITGTLESPGSGVLRALVVAAGESVPVGATSPWSRPPPCRRRGRRRRRPRCGSWPKAWSRRRRDRSPTVEVDGRTLSLRHARWRCGWRGPVVLVHGYGGDKNSWLFVQEPLADGRTVHALDLPGHGESTKDVGDGSLTTLANAVLGFLENSMSEGAPRRPLARRRRRRGCRRGHPRRSLRSRWWPRPASGPQSTPVTCAASPPPRRGEN